MLSRFDLIYIVLDKKDEKTDRIIADKVTKNHRFRSKYKEDLLRQEVDTYDEPTITDSTNNEEMFLKYNVLTHQNKRQKILSKSFIQKYIRYAKENSPVLTKASSDRISKEWTQLRSLDLDMLRG